MSKGISDTPRTDKLRNVMTRRSLYESILINHSDVLERELAQTKAENEGLRKDAERDREARNKSDAVLVSLCAELECENVGLRAPLEAIKNAGSIGQARRIAMQALGEEE